jgi:hypothetical protein
VIIFTEAGSSACSRDTSTITNDPARIWRWTRTRRPSRPVSPGQRRSDHRDSAGERPSSSLRTPRGVVPRTQPHSWVRSTDRRTRARMIDKRTPPERADSLHTRRRSGRCNLSATILQKDELFSRDTVDSLTIDSRRACFVGRDYAADPRSLAPVKSSTASRKRGHADSRSSRM